MSASQGLSIPSTDVERGGATIDDAFARQLPNSARRRRPTPDPTPGAKPAASLGVRLLRRYTTALFAVAVASLLGVVLSVVLSAVGAPRDVSFVWCLPLFLAGFPVVLADLGAWLVDSTGSGQLWQGAFWTMLGVFCVTHLVATVHLCRAGHLERGLALAVLTSAYSTAGVWISFATLTCLLRSAAHGS